MAASGAPGRAKAPSRTSLPDGHSDFIMAVAGEEFGVAWCVVLIALFAFVVLRGFNRAIGEHSLFVLLAAAGLLVQFGLQALINMGSAP